MKKENLNTKMKQNNQNLDNIKYNITKHNVQRTTEEHKIINEISTKDI